jgi:hypothetical protein
MTQMAKNINYPRYLKAIKDELGNTVPTRKHLQMYIDVIKSKYNLPDDFDRYVLSETVIQIPIGR